MGFIKKPKIIYDNEHDYYKDGFHMLIPGIQITREFKKHIINTLIEEKTLEKIFKEITPHKSNTRSEFLDINSIIPFHGRISFLPINFLIWINENVFLTLFDLYF